MKQLLIKTTSSKSGIELTFLRLIVGLIFLMHGSQKLFGLFGGGGLTGTAGYFASIGLEPSGLLALLAGSGEFFGGLLLMMGLLTRPAAILTSIVSVVALLTVHLANGFFMSNNGFEYILILLVVSLAIFIAGSGKYSVDNIINNHLNK